MPPRESVLALTVIVREAPSVTAPVVWVRLAVPAKVRSPPKVTAFVIAAATDASRVPPLMVRSPAVPPLPPKAKFALPATSVAPAASVVPPT